MDYVQIVHTQYASFTTNKLLYIILLIHILS